MRFFCASFARQRALSSFYTRSAARVRASRYLLCSALISPRALNAICSLAISLASLSPSLLRHCSHRAGFSHSRACALSSNISISAAGSHHRLFVHLYLSVSLLAIFHTFGKTFYFLSHCLSSRYLSPPHSSLIYLVWTLLRLFHTCFHLCVRHFSPLFPSLDHTCAALALSSYSLLYTEQFGTLLSSSNSRLLSLYTSLSHSVSLTSHTAPYVLRNTTHTAACWIGFSLLWFLSLCTLTLSCAALLYISPVLSRAVSLLVGSPHTAASRRDVWVYLLYIFLAAARLHARISWFSCITARLTTASTLWRHPLLGRGLLARAPR